MQKLFRINSSHRSYDVTLIDSISELSFWIDKNTIIICDALLKDYLPKTVGNVLFIPALEINKSLETVPTFIAQLQVMGGNRKSHIVAIGGGIIQDISAFIASIFMRGIEWTYLPTTFLGMVDSCIGGKSSINVLTAKNLVGNFYPPQEVLIDCSFLASLPVEHVAGGLLEAIKICYAKGDSDFAKFLKYKSHIRLENDHAREIIKQSLSAKKWFIEVDEFDQKERLLLNFGHTFGHAIESASNFDISHGIGVGIGMIIAVEYAKNAGLLSKMGLKRTGELVDYIVALLHSDAYGKILSRKKFNSQDLLKNFEKDKKHRLEHFNIIVPSGDGNLKVHKFQRNDEMRALIAASFMRGLDRLSWPTH